MGLDHQLVDSGECRFGEVGACCCSGNLAPITPSARIQEGTGAVKVKVTHQELTPSFLISGHFPLLILLTPCYFEANGDWIVNSEERILHKCLY